MCIRDRHKIASMIKVSDELLQDSVFDIENYIATELDVYKRQERGCIRSALPPSTTSPRRA